MSYTHLSLFSGIGGLDLAAEWAGFETVGQCEFADYPTKVLEKHWPQVERWRDIRDLTGEDFYARTGLRTVDVISGGFPCQPFSVAGKQKGKEDDRYLWPEMLRVIRELAPRCVVGENVPGIIRIAAGQVVKDLEQAGYHVVVFNFEAAAVGALHRRGRVAFVGYAEHDGLSSAKIGRKSDATSRDNEEGEIQTGKPAGAGESKNAAAVAHADGERLQGREQRGTSFETGEKGEPLEATAKCRETVVHSKCAGLQERDSERVGQPQKYEESESPNGEVARGWAIDGRTQWAVEPDVGRVAHGVPNRVDRLKCLGNAVVPQQFYPIFLALMQELRREDGV